ncbi:riboflavin kinase [Malassezia obtusa]|uniref:Riboflavin kinase n=1 Tax=Malassezia obtusa TaxID=76774 RepID=A0AAF0E397_9BASI|nr:riboflavin kinase [Malassezia obtusa]
MANADGQRRPAICGGDTPEPPFPVYLRGIVEHGFGRGSKQLNCPTANLPLSSLDAEKAQTRLENTGVYFGFAQVRLPADAAVPEADRAVHPMVMSVGWNPHFKNTKKTVEVHLLHAYDSDFYGQEMRVIVLGYIRPELEYHSLDALIDDIETDKRVGRASVDRPHYAGFQRDAFFE